MPGIGGCGYKGTPYPAVYGVCQASHGMRQLRTYKSPIVDRDGITVLGTVGIGHDVTDLVNMSAEIEILLQSMPYAILLWDNNGRYSMPTGNLRSILSFQEKL